MTPSVAVSRIDSSSRASASARRDRGFRSLAVLARRGERQHEGLFAAPRHAEQAAIDRYLRAATGGDGERPAARPPLRRAHRSPGAVNRLSMPPGFAKRIERVVAGASRGAPGWRREVGRRDRPAPRPAGGRGSAAGRAFRRDRRRLARARARRRERGRFPTAAVRVVGRLGLFLAARRTARHLVRSLPLRRALSCRASSRKALRSTGLNAAGFARPERPRGKARHSARREPA